jgi:hypothetical protein
MIDELRGRHHRLYVASPYSHGYGMKAARHCICRLAERDARTAD